MRPAILFSGQRPGRASGFILLRRAFREPDEGQPPSLLPDRQIDLFAQVRVLLEVLFGVLPPLPDLRLAVRVERPPLLHHAHLHPQIQHVPHLRDPLVVHDVELRHLERRRYLVLHHPPPRPAPHHPPPRHQRRHPIHHRHVHPTAPHQRLRYLQRLLPRIRLRDIQLLHPRPAAPRIPRVQRVFHVDVGAHPAQPLRFRYDVLAQRRLPRRLRPIDLRHPPPPPAPPPAPPNPPPPSPPDHP